MRALLCALRRSWTEILNQGRPCSSSSCGDGSGNNFGSNGFPVFATDGAAPEALLFSEAEAKEPLSRCQSHPLRGSAYAVISSTVLPFWHGEPPMLWPTFILPEACPNGIWFFRCARPNIAALAVLLVTKSVVSLDPCSAAVASSTLYGFFFQIKPSCEPTFYDQHEHTPLRCQVAQSSSWARPTPSFQLSSPNSFQVNIFPPVQVPSKSRNTSTFHNPPNG